MNTGTWHGGCLISGGTLAPERRHAVKLIFGAALSIFLILISWIQFLSGFLAKNPILLSLNR